jgi:hypothetical protein
VIGTGRIPEATAYQGTDMFFSQKERNQLVALGKQAKQARIRNAPLQYEEAIVKIDALQLQLICKYPHQFQLLGAQK